MPAKEKRMIVIRFGELWLRGKNRSDYINILLSNMEVKFSGLKYRVDKHYDKIIIRPSNSSFKEVLRRMGFLFGFLLCMVLSL